jgi:hypothetical protein
MAPQLFQLRRQHVLSLQIMRISEPDFDPLAPVARQSPLRMPPSLQAMITRRSIYSYGESRTLDLCTA